MARDQLRPLEGQTVIIEARVSSHCRRGDFIDVSYEDCLVWPYRTDTPQLAGDPIHVDHLWEIAPGKIPPVGSETHAIGTVYWYCRKDGSLDLSIKREKSACLASVLEFLLSHSAGVGDSAQLGLCRSARKFIGDRAAEGRLLLASDGISIDEMISILDRRIRSLERNFEVTVAALTDGFTRRACVNARRAKHRGSSHHSFAAMCGRSA